MSKLSQVLLATALVAAKSKSDTWKTLRSLVDPGSQSSFITETAAQLLGLPKEQCKSHVLGLGGDRDSVVTSGYVVNFHLQSLIDPSFIIQVKAHIIKNITTLLPDKQIAVQRWSNMSGIRLADPTFNTPNKIDLLLGADVYAEIIQDGLIRCGTGMPVAQNSKLGWILSGKILSSGSNNVKNFHSSVRYKHAVEQNSSLQPKVEEKGWTEEEQMYGKISYKTEPYFDGNAVILPSVRGEDFKLEFVKPNVKKKRYKLRQIYDEKQEKILEIKRARIRNKILY